MEKNSVCRHCVFMQTKEIMKKAWDALSLVIYSCVLGRQEFGTEKGCRLYQRDDGQLGAGGINTEEAEQMEIIN